MIRLIRSEILKIRTTNTWWIFALASVLTTGLTLAVNCAQAHYYLNEKLNLPSDLPADQAEQARQQFAAQHQVVTQSVNVFTSGQFFGCLFVALLGILLITNEYYHQTATATFLATPHRSRIVTAKLITGIAYAAVFWLLTTVIDLVTGVIFFRVEGFANHLGDWDVSRAVLLNLMAFAIWAVFGVGFGALIRSQIGATITVTVLYVVGMLAAQIVFAVLHQFIKKDWVLTLQVVVPSTASQIMLSPVKLFPQSPPQWVGAIVLIGYGILAGLIGTLILRKRDVS
ncbi:ABC transporter permease subunit [Planosporangium thailandense]|uniref:ABC transporter permease subunit n=1 Tax=Planosporangium thailandense TaxID=765197 RepID=A0ABX0XXY9_9ACTN|nr:ABC transporter permease subunit [Planosporangium thailandense]NJC70907.1 ABC transporter permease subunit [Planosporangium thailandense]